MTKPERTEPDGHIHTVPLEGPEHIESKDCWCEPILTYKDPETTVECWTHKGYEEIDQ